MMSRVLLIADMHFGHRAICKYRPFDTSENHDSLIIKNWKESVGKRDIVHVLGDAAFTVQGLSKIAELPGRKKLIAGNHDSLNAMQYLSVFEDVMGTIKYKGVWLSHIPVHPDELRGHFNIHGHSHDHVIDDPRYANVCVEYTEYKPVLFTEVKAKLTQKEEG